MGPPQLEAGVDLAAEIAAGGLGVGGRHDGAHHRHAVRAGHHHGAGVAGVDAADREH
jgi:hypothetical protein